MKGELRFVVAVGTITAAITPVPGITRLISQSGAYIFPTNYTPHFFSKLRDFSTSFGENIYLYVLILPRIDFSISFSHFSYFFTNTLEKGIMIVLMQVIKFWSMFYLLFRNFDPFLIYVLFCIRAKATANVNCKSIYLSYSKL